MRRRDPPRPPDPLDVVAWATQGSRAAVVRLRRALHPVVWEERVHRALVEWEGAGMPELPIVDPHRLA